MGVSNTKLADTLANILFLAGACNLLETYASAFNLEYELMFIIIRQLVEEN